MPSLSNMLAPEHPHPRLRWTEQPAVTYAIGDVHGCLDALIALEQLIAADAANTPGPKRIVMLGDYVDRGPASAQVIDRLLRPSPTGLERTCLLGNHEAWFLKAITTPDDCEAWLHWGGLATLASYGIDPYIFVGARDAQRAAMFTSAIPPDHHAFLQSLPTLLETPAAVFAHAGIRAGVALADQTDQDLIWMREPFLSEDTGELRPLIHGHTPNDAPQVRRWRIGIDTHCFATGVLTAARIDTTGAVSFISTPPVA